MLYDCTLMEKKIKKIKKIKYELRVTVYYTSYELLFNYELQ